ncbi:MULTISPECIES: DUF2793 domain-containing protein [unclassified Xanthobacter]|uniref:DUF2793 domain-containing protein n=1 Tax=unclassified Xanthobacter TaxID=2623496 RepID=UPI001F20F02B|nr:MULTISPECIES: DUF2793 domain-containing protein [unclassified Xanthobacter]
MATEQSANLALPYLAAAQAQKHVTHNEAVRRLDAYVQLALESVSATEPPGTPTEGARWFVPQGASGAFAGQAGKLAAYEAGAFDFLTVPRDTLAYVRDAESFARFDGTTWVPLLSGGAASGGGGQLVLESISAVAPPASPDDGANWFVPAGAGGVFAGHEGTIATHEGGVFSFVAPTAGTLAFIRDEWRLALYDGGDWVSPLAVRPTRSAIEAQVLEEDLVLSGTSVDTTIRIPARGIVLGVSTLVLSALTGPTSYDCGIAGESSKFGGTLGIAQGSSNSGVIGPTAFYAPTAVRLTAKDGAFTGGRVRVSIHVLTCPASAFPALEARWWAKEGYLLDEAEPALAADFSRERYALGGGQASSPSILQRAGGTKMVTAASGALMVAPADTVAFDYSSGRRRLLLEGAATNLFLNSAAATTQSIAVTAQSYTVSFWGAGALALSGAHSATVTGGGATMRTSYAFTPAAGTLTLTPSGTVTKVQLEIGAVASSYIATTTAAATRTTDVSAWSGEAAALPTTAGPCTIALRGTLFFAAGSKGVIYTTGGHLLYAHADGTLRLYGASIHLSLGPITLGGASDVGACVGWNGAGRIGAMNGADAGTDATAPTYGMDSIFFGRSGGMDSGTRFEIDELLIWPVKGSASAIQSQARVWA